MDELTHEQHDAIVAYVAGLMSEDEHAQFVQAMAQNEALREGVALEHRIRHGMKLLAYKREAADMIQQARDRRAMLENSTPETPPSVMNRANEKAAPSDNPPDVAAEAPRRRSFPMAWVAAAALVLLLGISWVIWQKQQDTTGPGPVADNDTTQVVQPPVVADTGQVVPPNTPSPTDNLLAEDSRRLSKAYFSDTPKFTPTPIPEETDADPLTDSTAVARDSASVWRAARLLGRGQDRQAADTLLKVVVQGYPGHWRAAAEWYLNLTYLRQNRRQQARAILNRIARTQGHPYQADAKRLRSELQ